MATESPYKPPEANITGGGSDSSDLVRAFLGPKNSDYYLDAFDKIEQGAGRRWHWPAFFVTWFWLGYRKMWLWFFAYWIVFPVVLSLLMVVLSLVNETVGLIAYVAGLFIVPPLFANQVYFSHAKAKIAKATASSGDPSVQAQQAARFGGTSGILLFVILGIVIVGILAAIAIPAYQDYVIRAQQ